VNVQTLRYYERRGLLREPTRSIGGHRLFPADAVTRMRAIRAVRRLGFTLDEVADLLKMSAGGAGRRGDAGLRAHAAGKLADVDAKLAQLTAIRETLCSALDVGCDDLPACAESPCCPLPFTDPNSTMEAGLFSKTRCKH
jgi:DNA-binding transcriptional MerR regulator